MSDNPRKKRLRTLSTAFNLDMIPLIWLGTYTVTTPQVIYNALSVGYRHLDLAENYNNLQHVKQALSLALVPLTEGGLGIGRKDIWITMKIPVQSINNISALLAEVGTDYFDLLLYHYPFSMFGSKLLHCDYIARSMHHTCSTPTARATLAIRYLSTEPPIHFRTAVLNKQRSLHRQHMPKQEPSSPLPKNSTS